MKIEEPKDLLRRLGVFPQKERGQNFLVDLAALQSIVRFGRPERGRSLIEIGPGLGALTEELADYGSLSVIEIEPKFCEMLRSRFPQVNIIEADVRTVDFCELGKDLIVFGNLPYSLSTDIILHLLNYSSCISRAVLLLQKEFSARLASPPGSRDYGVISIGCQLKADVRLGPVIPAEAFYPSPTVESQLVELRFLPEPRCKPKSSFNFHRLVAAAFVKRRKKLSNSLRISGSFDAAQVEQALAKAGVDPNRRPETLSIEEFCRISDAFVEEFGE